MASQFARIDRENGVLSVKIVWEHDDHGDLSHLTHGDLDYGEEDAKRLQAYHDGEWYFEGCYAVAQVVVAGTIQTIRSAGLWGIESDSDAAYRQEVEEEERQALREILAQLGLADGKPADQV